MQVPILIGFFVLQPQELAELPTGTVYDYFVVAGLDKRVSAEVHIQDLLTVQCGSGI